MQIVVEELGFNGFQFPISVFSLSKDTSIKFNQQHNQETCREQDAKVNYIKSCSACKKELQANEIIKVFRADKENKAYFTEEEIKAIKKTTDKLEITGIALNKDIPDYIKSSCYGLTIQPKSKTIERDKQAFQTLVSFLGEDLTLIGYFSNRNATHLIKVWAETNYLLMQKLAFAENSQFNEFMELHSQQMGTVKQPDMSILQQTAYSIAKPLTLTDFKNASAERLQEIIENRITNPNTAINFERAEQPQQQPIFSKEFQKKIAEQIKAQTG